MKRDLFEIQAASLTLDLFPVAEPVAVQHRHSSDVKWEVAFSVPVREQILAVFAEKPARWLNWADFRQIIEKHQIGFCFGHALYRLVHEGVIAEKQVYYGARRPGDPNYQGCHSRWGTLDTPGPREEVMSWPAPATLIPIMRRAA